METAWQFEIKGKTYNMAFPNVGQYYQIEAMKQALGRGFYKSLSQAVTVSAASACDMIDIEATLTILCPEFIKDLMVKNFSELGLEDFTMIRKAYVDQVTPKLNEFTKILIPQKEEPKEKEQEKK